MTTNELAAFLIKRCQERGLSIRRLSISSGLSPATVHNILKREYQPTLFSLNRLADYLGVRREYLWHLAGHLDDMEYETENDFGDEQMRYQFTRVVRLPEATKKMVMDIIEAVVSEYAQRGK